MSDPQHAAAGDPTTCAEPRVEYVTHRTLSVAFDKAWLADEADVDAYLATLMAVLAAGKRVQV